MIAALWPYLLGGLVAAFAGARLWWTQRKRRQAEGTVKTQAVALDRATDRAQVAEVTATAARDGAAAMVAVGVEGRPVAGEDVAARVKRAEDAVRAAVDADLRRRNDLTKAKILTQRRKP